MKSPNARPMPRGMPNALRRWALPALATIALVIGCAWIVGVDQAPRLQVLAAKHSGSSVWVEVAAPASMAVGDDTAIRVSLRNDSAFEASTVGFLPRSGLEFSPSSQVAAGELLTLQPGEARDVALVVRSLAEGEALLYIQSETAGRSSIQGLAIAAQSLVARLAGAANPARLIDATPEGPARPSDQVISMPSVESR